MNNRQGMIALLVILCIALGILSFGYVNKTHLLNEERRRNRKLEDELRDAEREKEKALEEAKKKEDEDNEKYSDLYRVMADKCGVSIKDERKKAMIIPLGNAYDEETLKSVLAKLKLWSSKYYDVKDMNRLLVLAKDEEAKKTYLMGQEFYVVIPKYKTSVVSLKELELLDTGKLSPVKNDFIDGKSFNGPVLICQNISDIAPNAEIRIDGDYGEVKFSPFVSLRDGELMLTDEVYNAVSALDMKDYDETKYDKDLFDEILSCMPKY